MSGPARAELTRRNLLCGGVALTGFTVLGGLGDQLFANRGFSDFISGTPSRKGWRERINQGLAECAAAGKPVIGSAGDYPLDGPLHIPPGLKITCESGCIIRKAYDDRYDANALLLTAGDRGADADGFEWAGGEFRPMDATLGRGNLATLFGHGWTFRNAVMRDWRDGQCFIFGGGGFAMHDVDARATQRISGTGAYRCVWNDLTQPSNCFNLYGICGDDVFQAVPISNSSHPRFGRDVGELTYTNCQGTSLVGRLIVALVVQGQPENQVLLPSRITNCTWRNVRGQGGHRSIVIDNSFGDIAKGSRIDNMLIADCDVDCSLDGARARESVRIWSDRDGIGTVRFDNSRITGSTTQAVMRVGGVEKLVIEGERGLVQGTGALIEAGQRYKVGDVTLRKARFQGDPSNAWPISMALEGRLTVEAISVAGAAGARDAIRMNRGRLVESATAP